MNAEQALDFIRDAVGQPQLELEQNNEAHPHAVLAWAQRLLSGWQRIMPGQANCAACMGRATSRTATWWLVPPDDRSAACGLCDDHALSIALKIKRATRTSTMTVPKGRR